MGLPGSIATQPFVHSARPCRLLPNQTQLLVPRLENVAGASRPRDWSELRNLPHSTNPCRCGSLYLEWDLTGVQHSCHWTLTGQSGLSASTGADFGGRGQAGHEAGLGELLQGLGAGNQRHRMAVRVGRVRGLGWHEADPCSLKGKLSPTQEL